MKLRFLILILFLAVVAQPALPQQANGPLGKDQVMDLVKAGMETPELVKLIRQHGVDFDLTDDYLQGLRNAGAQEPVIQALRAAKPKPLSKEQVLQLVAGHVPIERATALVKQHGIDFLADERYLQTLRLAGGDDALIAALREASAAVTGELVVTTSPNAEVYLEGELAGKAGAQGELAVKARPGAHALKVSLKGKKDFETSVTLAARQATKIEARMEDVAPSPGTVRENPKRGLKYVAPPAGPVRENPKDRLKYAWIPPGTFMMGCSPGDSECYDGEKPAHQVTITKGFWIGQTAVTVAAYKRFAGATGRQMRDAPGFNSGWANDAMPIVDVDWDDATAFCGWAGGRLPTDAEWEYAARAGSTEARYGPIDEVAWYSNNSGGKTHEVGQKRANGFGLYDVLGNVSEWVNDWYGENYYPASPERDPRGPDSGQYRVVRGGSWDFGPRNGRVSYRYFAHPSNAFHSLGVRCAREVDIP